MTALSEEQQQALDARPATERPERAPRRTKDAAEPTTLAQALVAAQAEMPAVEKDSVNPHFKSRFTSLDHLIAKTRPVLNRHGISITQWPTFIPGAEPHHALRTTITHVSGGSDSSVMPLIVGKNDMQGLGGALTYAKRYMWAAACAISTDEDDDGNAASRPEVTQARRGAVSAPRSASQPKEAPAPVQASADDLAAYRASVEAADLDWPAAQAALGPEPVSAATLAEHRGQLAAYLAKVAAKGAA